MLCHPIYLLIDCQELESRCGMCIQGIRLGCHRIKLGLVNIVAIGNLGIHLYGNECCYSFETFRGSLIKLI